MQLRVICAWCERLIRIEEVKDLNTENTVSHGICPRCKAKVLDEIEDEEDFRAEIRR